MCLDVKRGYWFKNIIFISLGIFYLWNYLIYVFKYKWKLYDVKYDIVLSLV